MKGTKAVVHKNFLSADDKENIDRLIKENKTSDEIAKILNFSHRQVRTYMKQRDLKQTNRFTVEEDILILFLYNNGITKEAKIAKHIPSKAPWMIRNRLRKMSKDHMLKKEYFTYNVMPLLMSNHDEKKHVPSAIHFEEENDVFRSDVSISSFDFDIDMFEL